MMSNSSLVTYRRIVTNKTLGRGGNKITKIFVHHMAGNLTVKQCGSVFDNRQASAHYGVNGFTIGQYVDEKDTAWHCGNFYWNQRSIGIELANDGGAGSNWHVSDKTISTAINLIADICKRNGIKKLNYTGDMSGNLCMHRWVASTSCPGPYLATQFKKIASGVNKKLSADAYVPKTAYKGKLPSKTVKHGDRGEQVERLKDFLKWRFNYKFSNDVFGAGTEKAVRNFQRKYAKQYGLKVDGIFGPACLKVARKIVDKYERKYGETKQDKMLAWAKKIADETKYHYVRWIEGVAKTHTCPICTGRKYDDAYGGNCIWYAWASWHHGAGLPCKCSCYVFTDYHYNQLLKLSDAEALKMAKERIGLNDIKLIRNKNGISTSELKAGDIIAYFDDSGYVHTALYIGGGQITDCTSGRSDNIKYGVSNYTGWKIKLAFRYIGK